MQIGDLVRWIDYYEIQYIGYWMERVGVIIGKNLTETNRAYSKTVFIVATNGQHFELSEKNDTLEVISEKQ